MIRRPPRSTQSRSSAASDVYKRQRMNSWTPSRGSGRPSGSAAEIDTAGCTGRRPPNHSVDITPATVARRPQTGGLRASEFGIAAVGSRTNDDDGVPYTDEKYSDEKYS